jgi:hypothetical protein
LQKVDTLVSVDLWTGIAKRLPMFPLATDNDIIFLSHFSSGDRVVVERRSLVLERAAGFATFS